MGVESAVTTLDIVPTVLGAVGIPYEPTLFDGRDLFSEGEERFVYSVWEREHALQDGQWKLTVSDLDDPEGGRLFDLELDPAERRDLAGRHPDTTRRMRELLHQAASRRAGLVGRTTSTVERLKAIGYVQ
jgi:arylsulfatase A-like enzyme